MIIYTSSHEGRGISNFAKAICNRLHEEGVDTYQANNCLVFEDDECNFDEVATMIKYCRGDKAIILLSNNPLKSDWIAKKSVAIKDIRRLTVKVNKENKPYLLVKKKEARRFME